MAFLLSAACADAGSNEGESDSSSSSTGDPGPREYVPETGVATVNANGIEIAYFDEGEGPLVIMLHGFPDTAHTWDAIAPQIAAAGFRTVRPFLRGYAPSGIPAMDADSVTIGQDVIALIDALGYETAIVIGHDWGALATYAAANLEPTKITKIVTLAIPHPRTYLTHPDAANSSPHFAELAKPDAAMIVAADDFQWIDDEIAVWSPGWQVPDGELEPVKNAFTAPGSLDAAIGYYRSFAATPLPPAVLFDQTTVPALCFSGMNDGAGDQTPFEDQADAFTVPIEVVTLPTGHFIHREAEAEVTQKILAFLAG
jgi:pimeloyl-ACP methyl ester carboxylesterase